MTARPARRLVVLLLPILLAVASCAGGGGGSGGGGVTEPPRAASGDPLAPMPLPQRQKMTVGILSKVESFAPLLLANRLGEFEKENLEVEYAIIPPNESTLLAAQGRIDAGAGSFTAGIFNVVAQGAEFRFVYPGVTQPPTSTQGYWINDAVVRPGGGPLTASAFTGKKILAPSGEGSPAAYRLYAHLKTLPGGADLAPTDLDFQPFDPTQSAAAVKSGAAAAAQINSPFDRQLADDPCCSFVPGVYHQDESVSAYFFGRTMKERADVGAAFVRSLARTTRTYLGQGYREDPKVMEALSAELGIELSTLQKLPEVSWNQTFAPTAAGNLESQSFFRARGLLQYDRDLEIQDVYDTSYLAAIGVRNLS